MRKKLLALSAFLVLMVSGVAVYADQRGHVFGQFDSKMAEGVVHDGDYFAADDRVEILGTVKGDLYVAGGDVLVNATVEGDVLAAGGNVEIGGNVEGDVRVAGGEVLINGEIGRNVTATAGRLDLARNVKIGGGAVVFGGEVNVDGVITKDLMVGADQVTIDNQVGGNAKIAASNIVMEQGARIAGDFDYSSPAEANVDRKVSVGGEIERFAGMDFDRDGERGSAGFGIMGFVVGYVTILLVGLLFVWLAPNLAKQTAEVVNKKPYMVLLWGALVMVLMPIMALLLMVTVIGFPIGLAVLVGYFFALYFGKIFFALWVGFMILKLLKKEKMHIGWAMAIGLLVHRILIFVPYVGGFASFIFILFGFGAIANVKFELMKTLKKKKLV